MRRAPQQIRGQQRVDSILAAAEQVLIEHGFDGATTNQIAARAGVPNSPRPIRATKRS